MIHSSSDCKVTERLVALQERFCRAHHDRVAAAQDERKDEHQSLECPNACNARYVRLTTLRGIVNACAFE